MILNTGSRTDIPAFYSEWFFNRIKEGYCLVRNPYDPVQVTKYLFDPELIDCIVFCTKNPEPMLERIEEELAAFNQFWQVTITPYGKDLEPHVPPKEDVMDSFNRLAQIVGPYATTWRYDPIIITPKYSLAHHLITFEKMANKLAGATHRCVISFVDLYEKTKKNFATVRRVTKPERETIAGEFARVGEKYGMEICTCHEGDELARFGINTKGCMTTEVLERVIGYTMQVPASKKKAREGCDCLLGADIGVYNTCAHGCKYCYANFDYDTVLANLEKHDPSSPFLIGHEMPEDVVKEAKQERFGEGQISLFR